MHACHALEPFGHMGRVHAWQHAQPQQTEEMHGGELLLPAAGGCAAQRPVLVDHGNHQVIYPRASRWRLVSRSARFAEADIGGGHWDAARRHSCADPGCARYYLLQGRLLAERWRWPSYGPAVDGRKQLAPLLQALGLIH